MTLDQIAVLRAKVAEEDVYLIALGSDRVLDDERFWQHPDGRHLMREAHGINRDAIFRDF